LFNAVPIVFQTLYDAMSKNDQADKQLLASKLGTQIRMLACGGAALPATVFDRFHRLGYPIYQGYGLTETSPVVCSNRFGNARSGTVGPPVHGIEIRVDQSAQLLVRGDHVMLGYWRDPEQTTQRIRDGWFATGDLVAQDPDGHLRILGRHDDLIVLSTGRKVSPLVIEQTLKVDPRFGQMLIIGHQRPHLTALVFGPSGNETTEKWTERDLLEKADQILAHFASFERPKRIMIINQRWESMPELLTHKGTPRRAAMEAYFFKVINEAYQAKKEVAE
jgi:long-chain acyl-CoA synthetase